MAEKVRETRKHEEEEEEGDYWKWKLWPMANPSAMLLSFLGLAGDAMEVVVLLSKISRDQFF